eukprot:COSAG02_NODE_3529_length_6610_cov_40.548610_2_plen_54_part_00
MRRGMENRCEILDEHTTPILSRNSIVRRMFSEIIILIPNHLSTESSQMRFCIA